MSIRTIHQKLVEQMRIQLISGPRNISTALMYSFAQRKDTEVVDEPLYAYYLDRTGFDHPGREEILKSQSIDAQKVISDVIFMSLSKEHYFIKNMSKHLEDLDVGFCQKTKNVFLIRDPARLITSFAKVVHEPTEQEIGLKASWEIFQQVDTPDNPALVLNSDTVLANPAKVLTRFCEKIDIPFDKNMLSWEPGPIIEDGVWAPYWYKSVHQSTGFSVRQLSTEKVPDRLLPLLDEILPYYNLLNEKAITIND
ncbi:MAG: hypothetical protein ACJASN_000008 [Cyclobacteriaceae bacterium]